MQHFLLSKSLSSSNFNAFTQSFMFESYSRAYFNVKLFHVLGFYENTVMCLVVDNFSAITRDKTKRRKHYSDFFPHESACSRKLYTSRSISRIPVTVEICLKERFSSRLVSKKYLFRNPDFVAFFVLWYVKKPVENLC